MAKKKGLVDFIKEEIKGYHDERRKTSIAKTVAFTKENPNCLIMMMDIKTDDMVAAYKGHYVAGRFLSKYLKRKTGFVKTILLGRKSKEEQIKMMWKFSQFVAEFLWQMSESAQKKRSSKEKTKTKK